MMIKIKLESELDTLMAVGIDYYNYLPMFRRELNNENKENVKARMGAQNS